MTGSVQHHSRGAWARIFSGKYFFPVLIILFPAVMFHFALPFSDTPISFGRDFARYFVWQQMENMISVKFGSFPIYIPAVSGGNFCSLSAGLGQLFLPISYLAALLPGYWTGYAAEWLLLLNMLTTAAAHLALFFFLRRLGFNRLLAFLLSTVTVYSPRTLIAFEYGAGVATWAGHLFLCSAMGFYFLKPSRVKGPLLMIVAGYWLICSGHPEEVYYGMLGCWLFALLLPWVTEAVFPGQRHAFRDKMRFWLVLGGCSVFSFLLSSAYILPLYFDVVRNMDFADMAYEQAVVSTDTTMGLIHNFFYPTRSSLFGCFAGTSLYAAVMLLPLLLLLRVSVSRVIWLVWVLIGVVFLFMTGEATPVFSAIWHHLPFASVTRNPARASLIMPILFLLALMWLFRTRQTAALSFFRRRPVLVPVQAVLCLAGAAVIVAGAFLFPPVSKAMNLFPLVVLNALYIPVWVEPLLIVTGAATLLLTVVLTGRAGRFRTASAVLLTAVVCLHLAVLMRYQATPLAPKHKNDVLTLEKLLAQKKKTLNVIPEYLFLFETAAHEKEVEQFTRYFLEPRLGKIYRRFLPAADRDETYRILNHGRRQDEVVIEGRLPPDIEIAAAPDCDRAVDTVSLTYSAYNRLMFETTACQPSFFVLSYPDSDQHWRAEVNGERAPIYSANGVSQAVLIPAGKAVVEFRYWSNAAFAGMLLSCLTLAVAGILAGLWGATKPAGYVIAAAAAALASGLLFAWYASLYSGDSFSTRYFWQTPPADSRQWRNLAYGKPASISARNKTNPAYLHARRGVDGDRSYYSCFVTAYHREPWFMVDLEEVSAVGSIVITATLRGYEDDKMILYFNENVAANGIDGVFVFQKVPVLFNNLPLVLAVSKDGENWEFARVDNLEPDCPHEIRFEEPVEARYIRIIATGRCRLCLNEVEVYPPEGEVAER